MPTPMEFPPLRWSGFALTLVLLTPLATPAQTGAPHGPLQTIERLDVARYLGTWFEIAKYPNRFQRQCVADTQAQYRQRDDGQLDVVNRCRQANGEMTEAVGRARQVGATDSPRLEVRFAPAWLSWLPMVWGDYWVIDLDPAYQALLGRLQAKGFDLSKLELTAQPK